MEETEVKPKKRKLTKKQRGFVRDYVLTENGVQAALKNYDVADYKTAAVIASENINKPYVKEAIEEVKRTVAEALTDELLLEKHLALLDQARFDYFTFPKKMSDEEVEEKVNAVGMELVVIQDGEKGRYAFYKTIDAAARKSGLEMAYKLKGSYAPEKSVSVNIDVEADSTVKELTERLNAIHRGNGVPSHGGTSGSVGTEIQNQE